MEFRPVLVTVVDEQRNGSKDLKVQTYDLHYDELFENCKVRTLRDSDSGFTEVREYSTNSAFILSPYKLFSAVFDKEGNLLSNDVGSTFRVYNVYPQMCKSVRNISEIKRAGYIETFLGDGQANTDIFFDLATSDGAQLRWILQSDHNAWQGILNDLKWEESNKEKFKGRDILDTYILSSDYPGFK
uniref:21 kDa protein n=1 Tax=Grapevine leafroll-associated virus 3 TaxID=55951 RepID=A0A0F6NTX8_9CLOS|nr:21 kDa protein [Grapevine leafroll-associated virus 3]